MPTSSPVPFIPGLDALRAELRCIMQHPAIAPARRECAEQFISRCQEAKQLQQWLALLVAECGRWEELALSTEAATSNGETARKLVKPGF